ncbi:hypothetical protein [Pseudomonas sp. P8_250]|uniref:hypothetical protein n=1 Tax=Pseudomonas sp. P8_250 TaxID=3043446 RepID=UPI002A364C8A|nr:hypothetical protein [Pseudomonas sp. P8_250]MDX9668728.1 hypothetical protein [Pseudomonas sp. P8_250]
MIRKNTGLLDIEDAAVLFAAMTEIVEIHEEELDRTLVTIGYGEGLARCMKAAEYVAKYHTPEGDNWDGVEWFERLEATDVDSLAYQLFVHEACLEEERRENWEAGIRGIVLAWYESCGEVPNPFPSLSSDGNRF